MSRPWRPTTSRSPTCCSATKARLPAAAEQPRFFAVAEQFLSQCIGGRAEPIGDALQGSTVKVTAGGELIPGLAQLATKAATP